jgi:ACT domain-containing protein
MGKTYQPQSKNRMTKTNKNKELILEQLRKTPIAQVACEKMGISRMTFHRWKKDDKEFSDAVDLALSDGNLMVSDLAESQLVSAIKDRNLSAIMYWLKYHHPSYRTRVEIQGTINTIQELSEEQKELVRKALELADITLKENGEQ